MTHIEMKAKEYAEIIEKTYGIKKTYNFRQVQQLMSIANNCDKWQRVEDGLLPDIGVEVNGYSKEWIDADFNPKGIRVCWINESKTDGYWVSARYNNYHDCYETEQDPSKKPLEIAISNPTHFQPLPNPPHI